MFYRYYYDAQGLIQDVVSQPGQIGQPVRVQIVSDLPFVESNQLYDMEKYQVDTTTHTLIPRDQ